jgi:Asp-tRNA(Asn)/Glu-tRNA(Gln) amidotransferase A subunit family amidase
VSRDAVAARLGRARALHSRLGAFTQLTDGRALEEAAAVESRAAQPRPLDGTAIAVKDLIDLEGVPTRLGTPRAGHTQPEQDAAVVRSAVAAGAVVLGKTRTHELGLGMITPGARNPFDVSRFTGGSSGGAAAAVAAGVADSAFGTDTAGSVRCPAALCGVTGFKPTTGVLPGDGVSSLAPTQDTVGTIGATVADCAALYRAVTAGPGEPEPVSGGPIGYDAAATEQGCTPDVAAAVRDAAGELAAAAGAELVEVRLPDPALVGSLSMVIVLAEAARVWGGLLERDPTGFGPLVQAALRAGSEISDDVYRAALRRRERLRDELDELTAQLAIVVTPTVGVTAASIADPATDARARRRLEATHPRFTALASVTGRPAISVPCGLDSAGLPIGLQLMAAEHEDLALLGWAALAEDGSGARSVVSARARFALMAASPPDVSTKSHARSDAT